jgi:hypothetical protein
MNLLIHVSLIFSQLLDHRIASWFMPSQLVHSRRHRIVSNGLDVALQFVVATRSEYIQPIWILACYIPCELKESHTCLAKRKRGNPILSRAENHFSIVLWAPSTTIIGLKHVLCLSCFSFFYLRQHGQQTTSSIAYCMPTYSFQSFKHSFFKETTWGLSKS